ncbi:hypothetical protein EDM56_01115 [Brevibacillus fluminis]|uniref:Uncharacterized protein n=1 Tax=Brevibacillus fluminis TaxID=511487 RepID=A0A3M8DYM6_9BACL|nr:DUF6886 family protein [Brevibacillus fluminis]RNB92331.1 hypothetical protein EDM56_01115 [Brevibacillus fluminis]
MTVYYYHFSEEATITRFEPRCHPSHPDLGPVVWAIDEKRAPLYFFPRDCPRIAFWSTPATTDGDRERFLGHTAARMVITVENRWLDKIRETNVYVYRFAAGSFRCIDEGAGYFIAKQPVTPLSVEPVGDLLRTLADAEVELRMTPTLGPLRDVLLGSTLHASMIRMRNAILIP